MELCLKRLLVVLPVAACVALLASALFAVTPADHNPAALWPDNVASLSNEDLKALVRKLQPLVPTVIAGKPYSITAGETPGTYAVKWGNESMLWKPEPWMEPAYAKLGPYYYLQWLRKGLPYRWELPLDQRTRLTGPDYMSRCLAFTYYMADADNGWDQWEQKIYLPDGKLRTESKFFEAYGTPLFGRGLQYYSESEAKKVNRLYAWEAFAPEELRGEGGITTEYRDPNVIPEDLLYLPTVRKTRRLAGAVAQQYFPGTIFRYEDVTFNTALPQLNYKVVGFKLFDASQAKLHGYRADAYPEAKRIGDDGDVSVLVEITPKPGVSWWYARRVVSCGLMELALSQDQVFDAGGRLIRQSGQQVMTGSVLHMGSPDGPPAPDWWTTWGAESVEEFSTGFEQDAWVQTGGYNAPAPASWFTVDTLARQPMTLSQWIQ